MASLLNFVDQNAETLQQMALLAYLKEPDVGEPLLQAITTYKVSKNFYIFQNCFKIIYYLFMSKINFEAGFQNPRGRMRSHNCPSQLHP